MTQERARAQYRSAANQVAGQVSDYALTQPVIAPVAGSITPVTVGSTATITAAPKTYDGLLAASTSTVSGSTSGAINGDVVALDTNGVSLNYNSAHVVNATTISASGLATLGTITGGGVGAKDGTAGNQTAGQAGDYALTQPVIAPVAGSITTATVNLAATRTYDATTNFTAGSLTAT